MHPTQMAKIPPGMTGIKRMFLKIRGLNRMKMETGYPPPVILAPN
jgi:hypothetical protein